MSTIKETALGAIGGRVPRGMGAKGQTALDALVEREQVMADEIVEAGVSLGATRDQVASILAEVGMHMRPTEPAAGGTAADGEVVARLESIESKLDKAIEAGKHVRSWARRQGYRKGRRY